MEGLQRIDRYLQMQPEARKEKAALQLAANIAYVFDAYLFYRPEMMTEWQKNAPRRGDAAWQARLWKKLLKRWEDRKSTRLNSSHVAISYAVFCLKKKRHR